MINRKIEPQHDEGTRSGGTNLSKGVPAWSKCPLGSAPARLLCLPRARLAALGSSALPGRGRPTGLPATAASRLQKAAPAVDHSGVRKSVAPDGQLQKSSAPDSAEPERLNIKNSVHTTTNGDSLNYDCGRGHKVARSLLPPLHLRRHATPGVLSYPTPPPIRRRHPIRAPILHLQPAYVHHRTQLRLNLRSPPPTACRY